MFVLRFTFENHRSFRDESDLTLVQPRLKAAQPPDGTWSDYTNRVAAVYGANASGKSCLVDALEYMRSAIRNSASIWSGQRRIPRAPFRLDEDSRDRPSTYALDFVIHDIRHEYGFSVLPEGVQEEWLYYYPNGRRKVLFERGAGETALSFGRDLKGGEIALRKTLGSRELVLSKGALTRNPQLSEIWHLLTAHITIADFGEASREQRLRSVISELVEGAFALDDLRTMLRVADIGIVDAQVDEQEADPRFKKLMRSIFDALGEAEAEADDEPLAGPHPVEMDDEQLEAMWLAQARKLLFKHQGQGDGTYDLPSDMQSTGTLTWLSLAAPALKTIRNGGVFVVDELDASLHPQLAQVMIQMFNDENVNKRHAQLIFTTHDTYFMSPTSDVNLHPDEIWLVEKGRDGASDLYSVADFPTRSEHNFSRRYLQGRYGAIPSVAPSFLSALIEAGDSRVTERDHHPHSPAPGVKDGAEV